MASPHHLFTPQRLARWVKQGRGQGILSSYKPWLTVFDVSSRGIRSRVRGIKTGRIHHLFSLLELAFFHLCEQREAVLDIREQYPILPQSKTREIAQELGIKHPRDPHSLFPIVMTTDFLLTIADGATVRYEAWSVKYLKELRRGRTLDKEELQRRAWGSVGVPWGLFTDGEVTPVLMKNLRYLHPYQDANALQDLSPHTIGDITKFLLSEVRQGTILAPLASSYDRQFRLSKGTALQVARHLLAIHSWPIDLHQPLSPRHPLVFTQISAPNTQWDPHAVVCE